MRTGYKVGDAELSPGQLLERLGFPSAQLSTRVGELSGGWRRRLQLLLVLLDEPNVLILDEPTNDLDTDMLTAMEDVLDTWPGTLSSCPRPVPIERVTDQQYAVVGGRLRHLPSGVDEYLSLTDAESAVVPTAARAPRPAASPAPSGATLEKELAPRSRSGSRRRRRIRAEHDALAAHDQADYVGLERDHRAPVREREAERDALELAWLEAAERLEHAGADSRGSASPSATSDPLVTSVPVAVEAGGPHRGRPARRVFGERVRVEQEPDRPQVRHPRHGVLGARQVRAEEHGAVAAAVSTAQQVGEPAEGARGRRSPPPASSSRRSSSYCPYRRPRTGRRRRGGRAATSVGGEPHLALAPWRAAPDRRRICGTAIGWRARPPRSRRPSTGREAAAASPRSRATAGAVKSHVPGPVEGRVHQAGGDAAPTGGSSRPRQHGEAGHRDPAAGRAAAGRRRAAPIPMAAAHASGTVTDVGNHCCTIQSGARAAASA